MIKGFSINPPPESRSDVRVTPPCGSAAPNGGRRRSSPSPRRPQARFAAFRGRRLGRGQCPPSRSRAARLK